MSIKRTVRSIVKSADQIASRGFLRFLGEKRALIAFLFHSLLQDRKEIKQNLIDPIAEITITEFRNFIEYFLEHNFTFIKPIDILNGLHNDRNYALITFDDGYANNLMALSIIREMNVPTTLFVAAEYIKSGDCFWWDVLFRERSMRGSRVQKIDEERALLKVKTIAEIREYLEKEFGKNAFRPRGDIDRPMTSYELKECAGDNSVTLGNHTYSHAILTNYSGSGIKDEIGRCQEAIQQMTGIRPMIISYPNGNYTEKIIDISSELGLRLGLTVVPKKNILPISPANEMMKLSRFMPRGNMNMKKQYELMRADVHLGKALIKTS